MSDAAASAGVMSAVGVTFDGGDPAINVEEIMGRIRHTIAEKKKSRVCRQDALLSQGTDLFRLDTSKSVTSRLALLNFTASLNLEGQPIVSHRPLVGFAIRFAKQLWRRMTRTYTDAIFAEQSRFNAEMTTAVSDLHQQLQEQRAENQRLRELIERLKQ